MVFNDSGLTFSQAQGLAEVILMQDTSNSTQVGLGFASNGDGLIAFNVSSLLVDKTSGLFEFLNGYVEAPAFKLKTGLSDPLAEEALLYWDDTNQCPSYYNEVSGISNQVGQELWKPVRNVTGTLIPDGSVVYINDEDAGFPTIALARADSLSTASGTIGFATHDIPTDIGGSGVNGFITISGTVRGLNTSTCSAGTTMYLSDSVAGGYTATPPDSPSWVIRLGVCGLQHVSTGTIEADINIGDNRQIFPNFFNGCIIGDRDVQVTSNGSVVTATLEAQGGGDLSIVFDGQFTTFDATPKASVELTAGTDEAPIRNYVYILKSTNLLTKSTTGWPATEFVPVADTYVGSAATTQTKGLDKFQEWTEHVQDAIGMGHLFHINRWVRQQPATYVSGLTPSFSGSGTGTVGLSNTEGVALQFHDHTFPAISDPAPVRINNDETTSNVEITNFNDISTDSTGTSLNNSTFAVVLWAVVNEYTGDCKWYANKPSGSYGAAKPADTRNDASGYTNYSIPSIFQSNSILVHRLILGRNAGGTVTTVYSGDTSDDLRGKSPNATVGGGGGGVPGLSAVLGVDNDAGGLDIVNVDAISVGSSTLETWTVFNPVKIHGGVVAGRSNTPSLDLWSNTYFNGSYRHIETGGSERLLIDGALGIIIQNSASGVADAAFSWTTHLTLDTNGTLDLPQATNANIVAAGAKAVVTKEYVNASVPATATSTGVAGTFAYASGWLYVCVATNSWQRVAIAAW
jgi:hypothetical protein